ncbi:MAG: serine protease [Bacteroidetes bacterium]|nr:MAG: serine protease [Bacteroidota bacterium]RLD59024.1 MAG: serine protease [Bacteroidota bacterium]
MKRVLLSLFAALLFGSAAMAIEPPDEGMWLPMFVERLNYVDMQEKGLQLTAEEIYSINNSSLKDAIVGLSGGGVGGFFCTGEIVSDQGLLFTNHHCGYAKIQSHSTIEHDYLKDGFWAMSLEEELPNEGMAASFLVRMEDVTDSIIPFLSDTLSEAERGSQVRKIRTRLAKKAEEDGKYAARVSSFFGGNEYYLFVYTVYKDVRLVGAPPSSIGKYGGDTDNWMWPRHTGDFSIFRVYTGPEGESASFAEENIPLKPDHHLPVSLDGYDEGDFAMIWGYPGGTERYLTSYGIQYKLDAFLPVLVEIFEAQITSWKTHMDVDQAVRIQYASKYAGLANAWKLFLGQIRGLKRLKVYEKKQKIEEAFQAWADADPDRKEKYGEVLNNLEESYATLTTEFPNLAYTALAANSPEILGYAAQYGQLLELLESKANDIIIDETIDGMKAGMADHFKDYYAAADKDAFEALMEVYHKNVPTDMQPEYFLELVEDMDGNFEALADYVFNTSIFESEDQINAFLEKPKAKTLARDPALKLSTEFSNMMGQVMGQYREANATIGEYDRLFIAGLREMNPDKVYCPDANSTMRMTYGSVEDYMAADAVYYDYYTTLAGVMEKEDPSNAEFIVEEDLKVLFENKDFGRYGEMVDGKEKMIVCFLTTNDITGGNSGSPVINGKGELIGIAFDGNWEAMSGDIAFEPDLQRTINVDIRYVLFIIDKMAGAQNLIDELTIVDTPKPKVVKTVNAETKKVSMKSVE